MKTNNIYKYVMKSRRHLPFYLFILHFSFFTFHASLFSLMAATKQEADNAYLKGNYQQAVKNYDSLIAEQPSPELYYNLGNSYFRMDKVTQAILAYERALQLSPNDKDIRFNLEFARSKTIDKIVPESEMFFFSWYRSLVHAMSVDSWARLSIVSVAAALVLMLLYLFANRLWLRRAGFYGAVLFLVVFAAANLFAFQQKRYYNTHEGAIVTSASVKVKRTPSSTGTDAFILHEGTRIFITDWSIANWVCISLDDGRDGWIPVGNYELISMNK